MKQIKILLTAISTCLVFITNASNFWTISSDKNVEAIGDRKIIPNEFILAQLSTNDFQLFQSLIPSEESGQFATITLPTPDGSTRNFKVFECPMMEKPLAEKYPQIKTYTAIAIDNPIVTAKLDFTLFGFHAKIFDGENTYFIDPYTNYNTGWYQVYFKKDFIKPLNQRMACLIGAEEKNPLQSNEISLSQNELPQMANKQNGTNKRTYRLALACTVEYSAAVGGATPTKASVLSAMVTSMNRVNGVFEKEFSMHANLVANDDTLIYIGTTDPYTNNSGSTMLGQNQTTVNTRIGAANYDYGHVFSTGGGGIASLGCVCQNNKAQGVTGSTSPVGDAYDIDYVAHEMGHQFGGNHTFNSVNGSCSGNRNGSTAYEIGSATTIMGYAGICSPDDIQLHSDDYYHAISLEEMTGTSVMSCASITPSNNLLPTLSPISGTFIIPYRTDFELTTSGTDPDSNPLTYCWEEFDKGGNGGAWDASTTVAPILRSFTPTATSTRVFPAYIKLIQNIESYLGERLPDVSRILKFKCTLRDLNNGYGAFYTSPDTLKLDLRTTTSLFRVTSQATAGITYNGATAQTVTWDVAGTNASPFTATNVDIYMSIDSGKTFPYTLAINTPNDGTETIVLPGGPNSNFCRIKVKGSGNVFFDLNDKFFTLKAAPASIANVSFDENYSLFPNPVENQFTIKSTNNDIIQNLKVIDMCGRVCINEKPTNSNYVVNTSSLVKGIYSVEIYSEKGKFVTKIMK